MSPYLSIITTARNDSYGAGGLLSLRRSINVLIQQLRSRALTAEILIVDWNTPEAALPIYEALRLDEKAENVSVKCITVPKRFHAQYEHPNIRMIHPAVAANVGFRRAVGEFVVLKVMDSFWSEQLVDLAARQVLRTDALYRCNRKDVDPVGVENFYGEKPERLFQALQASVTKTHERSDFQHGVRDFKLPMLHTNACGDFQLISRMQMYTLRGYQETADVLAFHVDSTLSYLAHLAGLTEIILPDECCVFKLSHPRIFTTRLRHHEPWLEKMANTGQLDKYFNRSWLLTLSNAFFGPARDYYDGVRVPTWPAYVRWMRDLYMRGQTTLNGADWGLGNENLAVVSIA